MAPEIALAAIAERAADRLTVLDPMCGSGTVLAVALQNGHSAIGVDIDPLAVMMSELTVTPIDAAQMRARAKEAVDRARIEPGREPWGDDEETANFVDYWFAPKQQQQLVALATAIHDTGDRRYRIALQLALSRIIVTKSPQASLAADTAHSRPHRVQTESDYDVLAGFAASAKQLAAHLERRTLLGQGTVTLGDARVLDTVGPGVADLVVTSPPYLNALDYLRGHKLALVWFGHRISDLRARRARSIGAERALSKKPTDAASTIVDFIEAEAPNPTALRRPMIERFAQDSLEFAAQLRRVVKSDGRAVLVVGNSTLRGNYIRNDAIVQYAMEASGFDVRDRYERAIPPSRRYMAITADPQSGISRRMRTEVVLTMGVRS